MPDIAAFGSKLIQRAAGHQTDLVVALQSQLPDSISIAGGPILSARGPLFPNEETAIGNAAPARRAEFVAGRTFARQALSSLGLPPAPIPRASDRRPIWPQGYVGSISHSRTMCICLAANQQSQVALGIDVESLVPLKASLYRVIGRAEECDTFHDPLSFNDLSVDRGKLTFSIKEAIYKAYNPITCYRLGFHDVSVSISRGGFTARLAGAVPRLLGRNTMDGRWIAANNHIVAALALPASDTIVSNGG